MCSLHIQTVWIRAPPQKKQPNLFNHVTYGENKGSNYHDIHPPDEWTETSDQSNYLFISQQVW